MPLPARLRPAAAMLAAALLMPLAGCIQVRSDQLPPWLRPTSVATTRTVQTSPGSAKSSKAALTLYFVKRGRLVAARRALGPAVPVSDAVAALLAGPTTAERKAGLTSAFPAGTRLLSADMGFEGVVRVDLSRQFAAGGPAMAPRLAQLVYTLCGLPQVKGVLITIEGNRVERFGRERFDLLRPLTPGDLADLSPV